MRFAVAAVLLAALAWQVPAAAQQQQKKIQCWTDKSGQRMCGDRVPPEYAGEKRDVVKDGRVVETLRASKTAEEIAEEKAQKERNEQAQRQADYDRALLETYRTFKDIESMRDERIAMIDGRLAVIEKNEANTGKTLAELRARADKLTAEGKPVDDKLARQIKQAERDLRQNQKSLERNRKEREDVSQKFNSDLERYCALRTCTPKPVPPAADAATTAKPGGAPATPATPASAPPGASPAPAQAQPPPKG